MVNELEMRRREGQGGGRKWRKEREVEEEMFKSTRLPHVH